MSNKLYDWLKWATMVLLPAVSVLYVALAQVWGWPYVTEVAATLAAVVAFLGTLLQLSSAKYKAEHGE